MEDYAPKLDATGRSHVERIQAAGTRMMQLIEDILSLCRVTQQEIRREEVDLSALVKEVSDDIARSCPGRPPEFLVAPGLRATGDGRLLRVVVENLIDNATKFTAGRPDARVEFGTLTRDGNAIYFLRDNGVGFDMDCAGDLFSPFKRLHASPLFPGTGVGLATVKRIIHRHNGRIWAEGTVGEGATFFFTL